MPNVAVVIPTQNRPALLEEALGSVLGQTLRPAEIIIVDDASDTPVCPHDLLARFGANCQVIRNETVRGLAYSRNIGVESARAQYVIHLDDDDLLAPDALEAGFRALSSNVDLDLVFLGVRGFGSRADHFNRVQPQAQDRVKAAANGVDARKGIVFFDQQLFPALLRTVPMAFQRVMMHREVWRRISALRWRAYRLEGDTGGDDAAKLRLTGPLRDSEWALYAAASCRRTALIAAPLYLQRCDGQGYSSLPANQDLHMRQDLVIKNQLAHAADTLPEFSGWRRDIRKGLGRSHFDAAYRYFHQGRRGTALRHLWQAMSLGPNLMHARLMVKMCLPQKSAP